MKHTGESIDSYLSKHQTYFFPKVVSKKDSKYICDVGSELPQEFCIAYSSLLFNLLIT